MLIASVYDFRKDIKSYLDKVAKNFETLQKEAKAH